MNVMDLVQKSDSQSTVILKTKILGLKEELDKVKERWSNSRKEIENEISKRQKCREEKEILEEKIKMLEEQSKELASKLRVKSDKLMEVTKYADEYERGRRALDHRKCVDLDRMASLEEMSKQTNSLFLESQRKCEEVNKKVIVVTEQSEKTAKTNKLLEKQATEMTAQLKVLTGQLRGYQMQLEQFDSREEKYDQTIRQLEARIKNALVHNERTDVQVCKLQQSCQHIKGQLSQVKPLN